MDKGLIVSIQNYSQEVTQELAGKCIDSGADGIRTDKAIMIKKPIIALEKIENKKYYITTDIEAINRCYYGNYIAIDSRRGNFDLSLLFAFCQINGIKVIADIQCIKDVENIMEMHLKKTFKLPAYFATTFSFLSTGYPDNDLIKDIVGITNVPVIAEGKYKEKKEIEKAYRNGASNICIGAEISDISYLTKKFSRIY